MSSDKQIDISNDNEDGGKNEEKGCKAKFKWERELRKQLEEFMRR